MRKVAKAASLILGVALIGAVEAYEVRSSCPVVDTDDFFFPPRVLEAERAWYSKHLKPMGEPSLSCGVGSGAEVYRLCGCGRSGVRLPSESVVPIEQRHWSSWS